MLFLIYEPASKVRSNFYIYRLMELLYEIPSVIQLKTLGAFYHYFDLHREGGVLQKTSISPVG